MVREILPDEPMLKRMDDAESGAMSCHHIDWTTPEKVSDDDLLSFVNHQYITGKARRYYWEREAAVQLAWCKGYQHLVWSDELHGLADLSNEADLPLEQRRPITINKLRGIVLAFVALELGGPLSWNVYPQTNDNDDVANARVQAKLIRHYWGASDVQAQTRMLEAFFHMHATGCVFARLTFDPYAGGEDWFSSGMMAEHGEPDTEEMRQTWGQRLVGMIARKRKVDPRKIKLDNHGLVLPRGEVDIKWVTGFDVTEPMHTKNVPTAPWIIVSTFQSIESLRQRYGKIADELAPESQEAYRKHYRHEADQGRRFSDVEGGSQTSEDVLVHELWRPRIHNICPGGFLGVCTSTTVLKKGKHPYVHGRIPLVRFTELPDSDNFRPPCAVRDLMSLQKARNERRSLIQGYTRATIDPRILVPKGSGVSDDFISTGPKVVFCNDGYADQIKALQLPPPPAYLAQLDEMDEADIEDVANIHRSTMGQTEGSGQSGKHAQLMQSGDRLVLLPCRLMLEGSASEVGSQLMALMWQYYDEERTLTVVGEKGGYEVLTFKGRSLFNRPPIGPHSCNVKAVLAPAKDPQEVREFIRAMVEAGVFDPINNEEHRATILRWINEELPPETDQDAEHRCNAARENEMFLAGAKERSSVRAAYGDNDATHIREHEALTTTIKFREAQRADPLVGMAAWTHIQEHIFSRLLKMLQPQAMAAHVQAYLAKLMPPPPPAGSPAGNAMGGGGAAPRPPGPTGAPQGNGRAPMAPAGGMRR